MSILRSKQKGVMVTTPNGKEVDDSEREEEPGEPSSVLTDRPDERERIFLQKLEEDLETTALEARLREWLRHRQKQRD